MNRVLYFSANYVCCFEHFFFEHSALSISCGLRAPLDMDLGVSKVIFSSCGGARTPLQILFNFFFVVWLTFLCV